MKLSIYYYLDLWMIQVASFLSIQFGWNWLSNRFEALINNSPIDQVIYKQMVDIYNMTPFEKKIIENEAFRPNSNPNENLLIKALSNPDYHDEAQLFCLASNIKIEDAMWNTEEIILLNTYRQSFCKLQRIYDMTNYYHKQHFLVGLNGNKRKKLKICY